jgi:hypothetical protein
VELLVDLGAVTVTLAQAADTATFAVRVVVPVTATEGSEDDRHRLGDVLAAANVGRMDGDHAFIRPDMVRIHAAGQVPEGWEGDFAAMIADAVGTGWVDPADGSIRAHVVWPGGAT